MRVKVKKIIPILLMVIFIITTFGGCFTLPEPKKAEYFADHEDEFYEGLAKIPKEVEGYALVDSGEVQIWEDDVTIKKDGEDAVLIYKDEFVYIRKSNDDNGWLFRTDEYVAKSATLSSIVNINNAFENGRLWKISITIVGAKNYDEKVFLLADCILHYDAFVLPGVEANWWFAPILLQFDIKTESLKFAGYFDMRTNKSSKPRLNIVKEI